VNLLNWRCLEEAIFQGSALFYFLWINPMFSKLSLTFLLSLMTFSSLPRVIQRADAAPVFQVSRAVTNYEVDRRKISVESYLPARAGKVPAIVLVHGADGLQSSVWNARYRQYAERLAGRGYAVFFPRYFERTGSGRADVLTILQNFSAWRRTVAGAVDFAARQPQVDGARIGLAGVSLGSSLSLALAAEDERVKAVTEFFGVLPTLGGGAINRLPPVLILHGANDRLVPVDEAYRMERFLQTLKTPYEIKIYPGQGHGFSGAADTDAFERAVGFFDKYLKTAAG
jgi:dipeptidyl aminopeptidase/acylaminoacyl peptidase